MLTPLSLSTLSEPAIMILRILGGLVAVAHFVIVWATLRLLFPGERSKATPGVLLAAFLPPLLYLSQFITNESLAAMLVSACVWLCLYGLKQERLSWKFCAGLGLCLGAALLAKSTSFLVLPAVLGALFWKWLERRPTPLVHWLGRLGLILAVCALVCGWHYLRLWMQFGDPLIGVWDPRLGYLWWQDEGYRTSAFCLRFGQVLFQPWFSALQSLGNGIYSTLWGDGLLGGCADFYSSPPWNYDLMAMGYWLALLPTVAVLAGGLLAVRKFIRQPSAEWFLVLGFGFGVAFAMVHMCLAIPYYCMVKAFYGLPALVPLCAFLALGLDFLARCRPKLRFIGWLFMGLWAINSYASFWILRSSVPLLIQRADDLVSKGRHLEAATLLKARLQSDPHHAYLRFSLARLLTMSDDTQAGLKEAERLIQDHPEDYRGHYVLALALARQHRDEQAIEHARRAVAMAPGYGPGWEDLAMLLVQQKQFGEALLLAREGLAIIPFSPKLRFALGVSLLTRGQLPEAASHLQMVCLLNPYSPDAHVTLGDILTLQGQAAQAIAQYSTALRLNPDSPDLLNHLARIRATKAEAAFRDGAHAVALAERACQLTRFQRSSFVTTLAAAYAEAGRFEEAVAAARKAGELAQADGDQKSMAESQKLIELFSAGQPYRENWEASTGTPPGSALPSN